MIAFSSCNKSDMEELTGADITTETVTETIDVEVAQGAKSTVALPAANSGYQVSTAATHATSGIVTTDGNGNIVYEYNAGTDYLGTDVAVVTTTDTTDVPENGGCNKGEGKGKKKDGAARRIRHKRININVTVVPNTTTTS